MTSSIAAGSIYAVLSRSNWAPPGWVFGPVWIMLFTLMGAAAWLVWRRAGFRAARVALTLFLARSIKQLVRCWCIEQRNVAHKSRQRPVRLSIIIIQRVRSIE